MAQIVVCLKQHNPLCKKVKTNLTLDVAAGKYGRIDVMNAAFVWFLSNENLNASSVRSLFFLLWQKSVFIHLFCSWTTFPLGSLQVFAEAPMVQ